MERLYEAERSLPNGQQLPPRLTAVSRSSALASFLRTNVARMFHADAVLSSLMDGLTPALVILKKLHMAD
jgi:hypothetical protein